MMWFTFEQNILVNAYYKGNEYDVEHEEIPTSHVRVFNHISYIEAGRKSIAATWQYKPCIDMWEAGHMESWTDET